MTTFYGYEELCERLDIIPPVLMLDRAYVEDEGRKCTGLKAVTIGEDYFVGHFPGSPIMPGVLQVAGMVQTAKIAILTSEPEAKAGNWQLKNINNIKFRSPVYPGDRLLIKTDLQKDTEGNYTVKARTEVDGQVTCQGNLELANNAWAVPAINSHTFAPNLPGYSEKEGSRTFDVNDLMQLIPHRYPFLLVDRILSMDTEKGDIVAVKNITGNEPFIADQSARHLPPELHAEIAAQAGCSLALARSDSHKKIAYFMSIDEGQFLSAVYPGDQLVVRVSVNARTKFGKGNGTLEVGDRTISRLQLKFAIVDKENT